MGFHGCGEALEGAVVEDMANIGMRLVKIEALEDFGYLWCDGSVLVDDDNVLFAARLMCRCCSRDVS